MSWWGLLEESNFFLPSNPLGAVPPFEKKSGRLTTAMHRGNLELLARIQQDSTGFNNPMDFLMMCKKCVKKNW